MNARFTTPVRMLGLALLILACSPLTAPFSTFDLVSLLGGATAPGGTSLQLKKPADDPVAALPAPTGAAGATSHWTCLLQRPIDAHRGCASLHRPLRI